MQTPLDLLCQKCLDMLQWKIDYRKYKPLNKPHKCRKCENPFVFKAYRTICDICATEKKKEGVLLCTKCNINVLSEGGGYAEPLRVTKHDEAKEEIKIKEVEEALE